MFILLHNISIFCKLQRDTNRVKSAAMHDTDLYSFSLNKYGFHPQNCGMSDLAYFKKEFMPGAFTIISSRLLHTYFVSAVNGKRSF